MSDKTKKGWLHHPEKESICLNIGSKEYESALDNGYVKNLTDTTLDGQGNPITTEMDKNVDGTALVDAKINVIGMEPR